MRRFFVVLGVLFGLSTPVHAGHTSAKITKMLFQDSSSLVYVYIEGGVVNPVQCAVDTGRTGYFSFSMNRPMSNEYVAGLLAAQMAGRTVRFWSKSDCIDQSGASASETLDYFRIEDY